MLKGIFDLQASLHNDVWLITPIAHKSLEATVNKFIDMPMDDEEDEQEFTLDNQPATQGNIQVINVDGVIMKHTGLPDEWLDVLGICDIDKTYTQLKEAASNTNIETILIYFNTPGGSVTGVFPLCEYISEIGKTKNVIGYTDTLCASAGYAFGSVCNAFYCSSDADIGSVGVYATRMDYTKMYEQEGIKANLISAGKFKTQGSPLTVMTDEEKALLQEDVNNLWVIFKDTVKSNRSINDEYLEGQCFDGVKAVEYNFADGNLNTLDDMISFLVSPSTSRD